MDSIRTFDKEIIQKLDNMVTDSKILGCAVQPPEDTSLIVLPGETCNTDLNGDITTRYTSMTI